MADPQHLFLHGSISKALLKLGIPIILINILQSAYQLTDAFWVGRLGAEQVAAVSVSMPVTFLVIAIFARDIVPKILFETPSVLLNSTIGTCLYAAA